MTEEVCNVFESMSSESATKKLGCTLGSQTLLQHLLDYCQDWVINILPRRLVSLFYDSLRVAWQNKDSMPVKSPCSYLRSQVRPLSAETKEGKKKTGKANRNSLSL